MMSNSKRPAIFEDLNNLEVELVAQASHLPDRLPGESDRQYRRRLTEALRAMGSLSRQIANQYRDLHIRRIEKLNQYFNH